MKTVLILLFISMFPATVCLAQGPVLTNGRAVASSQIRVSIPSFAIINLANNQSRSVSDHTATLKDTDRNDSKTQVMANDKWSVNVIREGNNNFFEKGSNKNSTTTYTVIYVTTQI